MASAFLGNAMNTTGKYGLSSSGKCNEHNMDSVVLGNAMNTSGKYGLSSSGECNEHNRKVWPQQFWGMQ